MFEHAINIVAIITSEQNTANIFFTYFFSLYGFLILTQFSFITCLALATASESPGMSSVMVEPAAMYAFLPTSTGAIRFVLQPINAPSPMVHLDLFLPS